MSNTKEPNTTVPSLLSQDKQLEEGRIAREVKNYISLEPNLDGSSALETFYFCPGNLNDEIP